MVSTTRWFFDTEFIDTGKTIDMINLLTDAPDRGTA